MRTPEPRRFTSLAVDSPEQLLFGSAPHPVKTRSGMTIGGGTVYPEINFTLPTLEVNASTMREVRGHYREIIEGTLLRAAELDAPGVLVEFETVPPMTEHPDYGMEVVDILLAGIARARDSHGLKASLRVTPNDNREFVRPPRMRDGHHLERMLELFDRSAAAGADFLSIESVGGKELHDEALMVCDLPMVIFSLCVLGARDMQFLWSRLAEIASARSALCAGDTACGFANTAMVLAEKKMIPRVFAAVVRAVSAVRSLVAYECGAVGPGKDCGYENIILKAITGSPMAMEGKSSACAHLSSVGNIAAAACDTWSNESVQNIKLLAAMAPVCSMEQLIYDCRLMNQARADGDPAARTLQRWLVGSDAPLDPQAYILKPESAVEIARAIVGAPSPYLAGAAAARAAVRLLRDAANSGRLKLSSREVPWLDTMEESLDELPADEPSFIARQIDAADPDKWSPAQYGL